MKSFLQISSCDTNAILPSNFHFLNKMLRSRPGTYNWYNFTIIVSFSVNITTSEALM